MWLRTAAGKGVGKALMSRVIEVCEAKGLRQMIAVIGDSGNAGSIGLHRALGFEMRGVATASATSTAAGSTWSGCSAR